MQYIKMSHIFIVTWAEMSAKDFNSQHDGGSVFITIYMRM